MRFKRPAISNLRLSRIHRLALLWLQWFAAFLDGAAAFAPLTREVHVIAHRWLDKIERVIVIIVFLRAFPRMRLDGKSKHAWRRCNQTQLRRAIIGSALRKALKRKDLHQRIAALSQNIDALVARLLKRLPHGLRRRRPFIPQPEAGTPPLTMGDVRIAVSEDSS